MLRLASTAAAADAAAAVAASAAVAPTTPTCVEGEVGVGAGCLVHLQPALRPEGQGVGAPHARQPVDHVGGVDHLRARRHHSAVWQHVPLHSILAVLEWRVWGRAGRGGGGKKSRQADLDIDLMWSHTGAWQRKPIVAIKVLMSTRHVTPLEHAT